MNLGASLLLWDQLFGTYEAPKQGVHDEVGVPFMTPERFVAQLAWPLMVWLGHEDHRLAGDPTEASEAAPLQPVTARGP